jgi:hypothetical protein
MDIKEEYIKRCKKYKNCVDLIAVYVFYIDTARWQKTNQPYCTVSFISKGLSLSEKRISNARKDLKKENIIKDIKRRDSKTNKFTKCYVKIIGHYVEFKGVEKPKGGKPATNALVNKKEILNHKKNACEKPKEAHKGRQQAKKTYEKNTGKLFKDLPRNH